MSMDNKQKSGESKAGKSCYKCHQRPAENSNGYCKPCDNARHRESYAQRYRHDDAYRAQKRARALAFYHSKTAEREAAQ